MDVEQGVGVELVEQHLVPDASEEEHARVTARGRLHGIAICLCIRCVTNHDQRLGLLRC